MKFKTNCTLIYRFQTLLTTLYFRTAVTLISNSIFSQSIHLKDITKTFYSTLPISHNKILNSSDINGKGFVLKLFQL